jgi:hypothetical protein
MERIPDVGLNIYSVIKLGHTEVPNCMKESIII